MQYIKDKTALVTGISKGIGRAVAEQLLAAGARVIGWGLHAPTYTGKGLHFIQCDVRKEEDVAKAMRETRVLVKEIHFLVNNAGFGYFSPIESFDSEQFRQMFEVNVMGMFYVTKAVAPLMQAQQSGHILNVSSIAGKIGIAQGEGYNATKWAVAGFSECLFNELRNMGIKVTTVFPGSTATNFFDEIPGFSSTPLMIDPAEVAQMMVHAMNTSPNFLVREMELRPVRNK